MHLILIVWTRSFSRLWLLLVKRLKRTTRG